MSGPRRSAKPPPLPPPRSKRPRERVDVPRFDPAQPLLDLEEHSATKTYDRFEADLPMPDLQLPPREGLGPIPMGDGFPESKTQVAAIPSGGTSATAHSPAPPKRRRSPVARYLVLGGVAAAAWGGVVAASQLGDAPAVPQPPAAAEPPTTAAAKPAAPAPDAKPAPAVPPTDDTAHDADDPGDAPSPEAAQAAPADLPRVAWSIATENRPLEIAVGPAAIVAQWDDRVAGYVDGAEAWTSDAAIDSLNALPGGSVLITSQGKAQALGAKDGSATFEVELPKARRAKKPPTVVAAATEDSSALFAFADARFVRLSTSSCGTDPATCLEKVGVLRGEYLEPSARVAIGGEGMRFLVEDESLRAFDVAFKEAFSLEAEDVLRSVSPIAGGRLLVGFGEELALLDTARCAGRATVRLAKQTAAPSGCVLWRFAGQLDIRGATPIDAETVAVNGKGRLQAVAEGEDSWKSPLSSLGPVVMTGTGGELLTLAHGPAEEQSSLSLIAVDPAKGTVVWTLPLGLTFDALPSAEHLTLRWQPGWLAVAADTQLALVELPATP